MSSKGLLVGCQVCVSSYIGLGGVVFLLFSKTETISFHELGSNGVEPNALKPNRLAALHSYISTIIRSPFICSQACIQF